MSATPADLARGLSGSALGRLGAVVDLAAVPILVWAYGLQTYGAYAIMAAALTLGLGSLDMGLSASLQRYVPRLQPAKAKALVQAALARGTVPSLLIAPVLALLAPTLFPSSPYAAAAMAAALPLTIRSDLAAAAARARRAFAAELFLRMFAEPVLRLAVALSLMRWPSLLGLACAHLAASAMTCWLMTRLVRQQYPETVDTTVVADTSFVAARNEMVRRGLALVPGALLRRALADGPVLLLGSLVPGTGGQQAAALFTLARKLASVPQMLRTLLASVMPPLAAAADGADRSSLGLLMGSAQRLAAALTLPLGAALAAMSPLLLSLMDPALRAALVPALLLIGCRVFESLAAPASAVVDTLSPPRVPLAIALGGAVFAVVAGILLVRSSLPPATAMASAVSAAVILMSLAALVAARSLVKIQAVAGVAGGIAGAAVAGGAGTAALFMDVRLGVPLGVLGWLAGAWIALRLALEPSDHQSLGRLATMLRLGTGGRRP